VSATPMPSSANASSFSSTSGGTGSRSAEAEAGLSSGGTVLDTDGAILDTGGGTEMSSDGVVLDTGDVIGANFTSLSVLFSALGLTVAAVAGAAANAVTGALVDGELSSDGAVLDTGDVIGANFTSLSVSFGDSDLTIAAAAGAAADAVAGASVRRRFILKRCQWHRFYFTGLDSSRDQ
jgi:hypothetical protein